MEKKYNYYDYLRYELFEELIPRLLYKGTSEEQNDFFQSLLQGNKHMIHELFQTMCEDDGVPYPYNNVDFETEIFERGGVNILQILLPPCDPEINAILRAYLLYIKWEDRGYIKKYFLIRRFDNGDVFNLYISPDIKGYLCEELTEHIDDMEYEYWRLVRDFTALMVQDMRSAKERKKSRQKAKTGNRRNKDKKDVKECSEDEINPDKETGLEEFIEYIQRIQKKDPE